MLYVASYSERQLLIFLYLLYQEIKTQPEFHVTLGKTKKTSGLDEVPRSPVGHG